MSDKNGSLNGRYDQLCKGSYSFKSSQHTTVLAATGTKAETLASKAELHSLSTDNFDLFQQASPGKARDWELEPGKEIACCILNKFHNRPSNIDKLDADETIFQMNWVTPTVPPSADSIKTNDGSRIWFPLSFKDFTGRTAFYITEKAVLKLAQVDTADEFERLHREERLNFPIFATLKVSRKPGKSDGEFNCTIVDALPQELDQAPTTSSLKLLTLFDSQGDSGSGVYAGALAMIHNSVHYALAIKLDVQKTPTQLRDFMPEDGDGQSEILQPCDQIVALIMSTERSQVQAYEGGCKLVTHNVKDITFDEFADVQYDIAAYCTYENLTDFKLDPPRGSTSQYALTSAKWKVTDPSSTSHRHSITLVRQCSRVAAFEMNSSSSNVCVPQLHATVSPVLLSWHLSFARPRLPRSSMYSSSEPQHTQ